MPRAYVPAVLALLVRVQVVQHGLGAAQAFDLHRDQLALLPGFRSTVGGSNADTPVLHHQVSAKKLSRINE